ncbi:ER membrane protein complex subunit 1 [Cyphellophora attinorum]|uniref:ER membrane protein complex subunit 1 n=1 Tax=Cyphellophora attinorum TaxID=1664694 RepID=A0A0N0NPJ6_9EURO|nr:ER membrane protein complex subunit 1 [Phialophora attinorum]KPI42619.1 ER membrane protein complex subunit 1 [Phialophora attinorum]
MRLQPAVWLLTVLLHTTSAIFSDDAFVVDYHHALVGTPQSHATLFHKPQSSSNASLIYTISDKHVLAAINPKDGTVLWRQVLESESKHEHSYLAVGERDGQIVSGYGTTVSSWDALDGKLRWQYDVEAGSVVKGLQLVPSADSINTDAQDVVAVAGGESGPSVVRLAGDGSGRRWIHQDSSSKGDSEVTVAATTGSIFYIVKSKGILTIDSDSLVGGAQLVAGSCTGAPFVVSAEKPYKTIRFNLLGSSKQTSLTLEDKAGEILSLKVLTPCGEQAPPHFLIHAQTGTKQWAEIYHIDGKTGEAKRAYSLPATAESSAFALQSSGSDAYVVRTTDTEITLYSSSSHGELGRWKRQIATLSASSSIGPEFVAAEVVSGAKGYAVRVAEIGKDGSLSLLRNGELQWSWIDAPSQSALIDELETEAFASPVTAYTHRLRRHFQDLQSLPQFVTGLVKNLIAAPTAGVTDARRRLVGERTVVLATTKNELIAVDASSAGSVTWQTDLKPHIPASVGFVHLAASDGKITVYLSDGSLAVVDAATGVFIEFLQGTVPASRIVEVPSSGAPVIAKVDANGKPHLASDFAPAVGTEGNIVVTLSEAGSAFGWTVGKDVRRTWTLQARNGEKFVSAVSRPHKDAVASIGKVLGDRSVLYKYVSPNLAVLTSASATTFSLYLIDAVTGSTLYTTSHSGGFNRASPSVVLSENWFAYSFSSQDPDTLALNTQLIIAELYESANPNDRGALAAQTNYSSYSPSAGTLPHVITQSFTVSEPLTHLAVTQTSQGITTRQLLAVLANSNGIASIPREILNARRPVDRDPTNNEKEEGLFRYNPILELEPRNLLSHSREVLGVKEIITSDSLLESTSLVFAYGHDVFGTSVTPSGAFDILGKGFNRIQLLLTIVALFGGVSLVRPLVTKKKVEAGWKA